MIGIHKLGKVLNGQRLDSKFGSDVMAASLIAFLKEQHEPFEFIPREDLLNRNVETLALYQCIYLITGVDESEKQIQKNLIHLQENYGTIVYYFVDDVKLTKLDSETMKKFRVISPSKLVIVDDDGSRKFAEVEPFNKFPLGLWLYSESVDKLGYSFESTKDYLQYLYLHRPIQSLFWGSNAGKKTEFERYVSIPSMVCLCKRIESEEDTRVSLQTLKYLQSKTRFSPVFKDTLAIYTGYITARYYEALYAGIFPIVSETFDPDNLMVPRAVPRASSAEDYMEIVKQYDRAEMFNYVMDFQEVAIEDRKAAAKFAIENWLGRV